MPTGGHAPQRQLAISYGLPRGPPFAFLPNVTLKIEIESDGETATLRLCGQIDQDHLDAIATELRRYRPRLAFDLAEAALVDRTVVQFLAAREGEGVALLNCPRYIREWISRELPTLQDKGQTE